MIQPLTNRSQIDAALVDFVAALRAAGLVDRADAIERVSSDGSRAEALGASMSGVRPENRKAFLHRAARSLQIAYESMATAARELSRATAAIERYHGDEGSR